MKPSYKFLAIIICTLFISFSGFAQQPKDTVLLVNGVCGMCQRVIENAALETLGVSEASWNVQSKVLAFSYDPTETTLEEVSKNIAKSGYDTELIAAKEEDYLNLHKCCYYRDPEVIKAHQK